MPDRKAELESKLRQMQVDQGGNASFAEFVQAVAADSDEPGHEDAGVYLQISADEAEHLRYMKNAPATFPFYDLATAPEPTAAPAGRAPGKTVVEGLRTVDGETDRAEQTVYPYDQESAQGGDAIGKIIMSDLRSTFARTDSAHPSIVYASDAEIDSLVHLPAHGQAVFKVVGKTQIDASEKVKVKVELVRDLYSEARFQAGEVPGTEKVLTVHNFLSVES